MKRTLALFAIVLAPVWAEGPLSLRDAVRTALAGNKPFEAAAAGAQAAGARIAQAQSGRLPRLNYSESFARSNNPVFVFSSLLTQHQFGVENFAIGPLNRPDFLNNFQSQVTVDQPIYDAGQTRNAVKSAELAQTDDGRRTAAGTDERHLRERRAPTMAPSGGGEPESRASRPFAPPKPT